MEDAGHSGWMAGERMGRAANRACPGMHGDGHARPRKPLTLGPVKGQR